jgi:hypothetical protein
MEPATTDTPASQPDSGRQSMSGGRIVLLIVGIVVALLGLAALAGGGVLLALNHTERDSAGFFSTGSESYASESHAIVSDDLDIGADGPDWLFEEGRLATVRVRGASADDGELFIGIGPTAQVREYLAGTSHDVVTDLDFDPFRATYRRSQGTAAPTEPGAEPFWGASAEGAGTQSVEWEVAKGNWSVVVMNADASEGVDARLSLGAKVGFVFWVGLGLVIAGAILLASGAAMIFFSLRRRAPATAPPVLRPTS